MTYFFLKTSTVSSAKLINNAMRRWKASYHHVRQQRRQGLLNRNEVLNAPDVWNESSSLSLPSHQLSLLPTIVLGPRSKHTASFLPTHRPIPVNLISKRKMCCKPEKNVNAENINKNLVKMEYAVRGPLVIRVGEIEKELKAGKKKPFTEVLRTNIGDPQAVGQKPITHLRQMLALGYDTSLFDNCNIPQDVKDRTKLFLSGCHGGSAGSYTNSPGNEVVCRQVADFITERDGGLESNWENILLSDGASPSIKRILQLLNAEVDCKPIGILLPIPQYPLYSATLDEYGIGRIGYYLDECSNWSIDAEELQRAVDDSREEYTARGIVIINPGNPTGQVLTEDNIKDIIKFAEKEKLVLLADEVYQDNIYDPDSKFFSFKQTLMNMGAPYNEMELVSFMSASKGYLGECGLRGGYMELVNIDPEVKAILNKSITASLCSTTAGQMAISALVNPPKEGDESFDLYVQERCGILDALKEKAQLVHEAFNSYEGFSCNIVQGSMYAFPRIEIPEKAIEEANKKNMQPDTFYAFELLESTGICVVNGSGFNQQPGTYHFRTTILPPTEKLKAMLEKFQKFHAAFMQKYK